MGTKLNNGMEIKMENKKEYFKAECNVNCYACNDQITNVYDIYARRFWKSTDGTITMTFNYCSKVCQYTPKL